MRLGPYKALIQPGTLAHKLYGKDSVTERHRHRYEFNPAYREELENAGMVISAVNDEHGLVAVSYTHLPVPMRAPSSFITGISLIRIIL